MPEGLQYESNHKIKTQENPHETDKKLDCISSTIYSDILLRTKVKSKIFFAMFLVFTWH